MSPVNQSGKSGNENRRYNNVYGEGWGGYNTQNRKHDRAREGFWKRARSTADKARHNEGKVDYSKVSSGEGI